MPIYEYKCQECNKIFDRFIRSLTRIPEVQCEFCSSFKVEKIISGFACKGTSTKTSSASCGSCTSSNCGSCG